MTKPKVSIVCVTYNQEKYIAQTLDSFVMQKTDFPFEVIVSDDCSTDKTAEIVREYANKYPNIVKPIFQVKNLGPGKHSNRVFSIAKSLYLVFCEGDDYFTHPLKLQKQVDFLDKNPDYSICFHPGRVFFEDGSAPDKIFPSADLRFNKTTLTLDDLICQHNFMQTNSVMYRWRFANEEISADIFPDNILPRDWFLHMLHAEKGKIGFIDETMAAYRRHNEGIWWDATVNVENLHLKYGIRELNFYIAVEKRFAKDKDEYHKRVLFYAEEFLLIYLKNKKFEEIEQVIKLCPDVFLVIDYRKQQNRQNRQNIHCLNEMLKKYKKRNLALIITSVILFVLLFISLLIP